MTTVFRRTTVPYTCDQMYHLVNDVEGYSQFVPGCAESVIDAGSGDEIRAALRFQYKGMSLGFSTLNYSTPSSLIKMKLAEGPFKYLEGEWRFVSLSEGCEVRLQMDFDFSNRVYAAMFKLAFNRLVSSLLDAFVDRARVIYGRR